MFESTMKKVLGAKACRFSKLNCCAFSKQYNDYNLSGSIDKNYYNVWRFCVNRLDCSCGFVLFQTAESARSDWLLRWLVNMHLQLVCYKKSTLSSNFKNKPQLGNSIAQVELGVILNESSIEICSKSSRRQTGAANKASTQINKKNSGTQYWKNVIPKQELKLQIAFEVINKVIAVRAAQTNGI